MRQLEECKGRVGKERVKLTQKLASLPTGSPDWEKKLLQEPLGEAQTMVSKKELELQYYLEGRKLEDISDGYEEYIAPMLVIDEPSTQEEDDEQLRIEKNEPRGKHEEAVERRREEGRTKAMETLQTIRAEELACRPNARLQAFYDSTQKELIQRQEFHRAKAKAEVLARHRESKASDSSFFANKRLMIPWPKKLTLEVVVEEPHCTKTKVVSLQANKTPGDEGSERRKLRRWNEGIIADATDHETSSGEVEEQKKSAANNEVLLGKRAAIPTCDISTVEHQDYNRIHEVKVLSKHIPSQFISPESSPKPRLEPRLEHRRVNKKKTRPFPEKPSSLYLEAKRIDDEGLRRILELMDALPEEDHPTNFHKRHEWREQKMREFERLVGPPVAHLYGKPILITETSSSDEEARHLTGTAKRVHKFRYRLKNDYLNTAAYNELKRKDRERKKTEKEKEKDATRKKNAYKPALELSSNERDKRRRKIAERVKRCKENQKKNTSKCTPMTKSTEM